MVIVTLNNLTNRDSVIKSITQVIYKGGLVAMPTDTVYGLVCRMDDITAIRRIYHIKGRDENKPLPVFVNAIEQVKNLVDFVSESSLDLIKNFWPGELTIVFPCSNKKYAEVTRNTGKIGLRMPNSKLVLELLEDINIPLASTSANISGLEPAISATEVEKSLAGRIDLLVDGGTIGSGISSTIIDVTCTPPRILRVGDITKKKIEQVLGIHQESGR